ncbi:MAG: Ubiquinone/menaquinone biosynthesis C-methylase UbiE [Chloroflexi bacterium]|jgi:ubiquinone/menaquinone biosynthesis C-methylase UbiE|nr:MAG: Ubiquinone/menaquinone biosynthesis C-methylase UbiE [Chloroflexota bacterium]
MSWLFAQWYGLITRRESPAMRETRAQLVQGLRGAILEVGVGSGRNLPLYDAAAHVTAVDYNRHMLPKAAARIGDAQAGVDLPVASVEALPFADDHFDHSVAGLVFCSVGDPAQGLRELVRVTRPGGEIRLWEHVAAAPGWTRRAQQTLNPFWSRLGDGCRLDRDTVGLVEAVGLVIDEVLPVRGLPRLLPARLICARAPRGDADRA